MTFKVKKSGPRWRVCDENGKELFQVFGDKAEVEKNIKNRYLVYENDEIGRWGYDSDGNPIKESNINIVFEEPQTTNTDDFFSDENIMTEEVYGAKVDEASGTWSQSEFKGTNDYLTRLAKFQQSVDTLQRMSSGDVNVSETGSELVANGGQENPDFGKDGVIPTRLYECPECGKKVEMLLKNGYCSKTCAARAKTAKAQQKVTAAGQKTLDVLNQIKQKLALLDAALNILTELPDLIRDKVRLPERYRQFVTLRIDEVFMKLKMIINLISIQKNMLLIQLLKRVKAGDLDKMLENIFQPIKTIMQVIIGIQTAMNAALAVIINLLQLPANGPISAGGIGWLMTAKSMQHPMTAGQILIEIKPTPLAGLPIPPSNVIDYNKIDAIVKKALPPIQEFEYFMDPALFKVRFNLSENNGQRLKKMYEMLEQMLKCSVELLPKYRDLKLTNIWFVLACISPNGWCELGRAAYGDFIFHGAL